MKVKYSKMFIKTSRKFSGKSLANLKDMISNVKEAEDLSDIKNCKKLTGFKNVYRIRCGSYRAFFLIILK